MAKTFEELKAAVRQWLDASLTELPDLVVGDIINIVQRDYLRRRESRFGEFSDTFPTVALQPDYAVPSGWSKPRKLWYLHPDNSKPVVLTYLDKDKFDARYPDPTISDDPASYTVWAGEILLGPTPSAIVTVNRDYYRLLPDLIDGTPDNENIFTEQAWEYLLFAALVKATEFGIEDARLPMWVREMEKFEAALDSEDSRRHQTGRVPQSEEPG